MMSPRERYQQDPAFHQLVDMMYYHIELANFTPTELREAALLAAIMYANHHPAPNIFLTDAEGTIDRWLTVKEDMKREDFRTLYLGADWSASEKGEKKG
jgi:hypothetical protein